MLKRLAAVALLLLAAGCARPTAAAPLAGAWRSKIAFSSGAFAAIRDLEFMYVFNAGGTLTESSNYDEAPPVPPAYGVWREISPAEFEARYDFYVTRLPARFEEIAGGGGWGPGGHGEFTERIRLAPDGNSFESTMTYEAFDSAGKPAAGGGTATGHGTRIGF